MLPPGVIPRQLQRALDRLGAGVAIEKAMRSRHRRNRRELLGKVGQRLIVKIRPGNMNQFRRLLLNRSNHFGMTMAGGSHGDAGSEINEFVSVHIFDAHAASAFCHQRIGTRIAGRDQAIVGFHSGPGLGAGQCADQLWSKLGMQLLFVHL